MCDFKLKENMILLVACAARTHNPKVVSSSLTPATKVFIRVARDCGLFIFCVKVDFRLSWGQLGDTSYFK